MVNNATNNYNKTIITHTFSQNINSCNTLNRLQKYYLWQCSSQIKNVLYILAKSGKWNFTDVTPLPIESESASK